MTPSESVPRDEFFESLLGDFLDESGQLLDRLNENLLVLDEFVRSRDETSPAACDPALLNEMFRSAHSLKGLSAMLGLTEINALTHRIENLFDAARKEELVIGADAVEILFQGIDRLGGLVAALKEPHREAVECEAVLDGIQALLHAAGAERAQATQADAELAFGEEMATPASGSQTGAAAPTEGGDAPEPRHGAGGAGEGPADPFAGLADEVELLDKYLGLFIDETELALDTITETLLSIEGGGRREELERLLVLSHRIKGAAASVGLNRAAKLAHLMEDALQDLINESCPLTAEMADALFRCTDALRQYVQDLRRGRRGGDDAFSQRGQELLAARPTVGGSDGRGRGKSAAQDRPARDVTARPAAAAAPLPLPATLHAAVARRVPPGTSCLVGEVIFQPALPLVGLKAQLIYEKLNNLGEVCHFDPAVEGLEDVEQLEAVRFGVVTDCSVTAAMGLVRVAGVAAAHVEPLCEATAEATPPQEAAAPTAAGGAAPPPAATQQSRAPHVAPPAPPADSTRPTETLRVDIERLDQLMNLAGELVISKARFSQIAERLKRSVSTRQSLSALDKVFAALGKLGESPSAAQSPAQLRSALESVRIQARRMQTDLESVRRDLETLASIHPVVHNDLAEAVHQLERVSDGIQQSVMDTRMVPIGPLFARFRRVIRDITRANGKDIRLNISGEKTELDKRMIDELGDPLIHMVRNAVDHGIEGPDARAAAGKPRQGTVTLDAFHRGNSIVIQVGDDGQGLSRERILRKAVDRGLLTEADGERMSDNQVYQLIWEAGLSTAEQVTEVSGRGMGMDIVKSKIEALSGSVDVESTPGSGTTMTIRLPLTLAILPSLLVEIDEDVFAMPVESVAEIIAMPRQDLTTVHGRLAARVRGRVISVVRLDEAFSFHGEREAGRREDESLTMVIVGEAGREIGLAVDRVLGEQDVVVKSMAENYRNVAGIAGASILGDGRVSLILDLAALAEMAAGRTAEPA